MTAPPRCLPPRRVLVVGTDLGVLCHASTQLRRRGFAFHATSAIARVSLLLDSLKFDAIVTELAIRGEGPRAGLDVASVARLQGPAWRPLVVLWDAGTRSLPLSEARMNGIDEIVSSPDLAAFLHHRLSSGASTEPDHAPHSPS